MAKSKKKKETTYLVCQETGDINYVLFRKPGAEKLQEVFTQTSTRDAAHRKAQVETNRFDLRRFHFGASPCADVQVDLAAVA